MNRSLAVDIYAYPIAFIHVSSWQVGLEDRREFFPAPPISSASIQFRQPAIGDSYRTRSELNIGFAWQQLQSDGLLWPVGSTTGWFGCLECIWGLLLWSC